MNMHRLNMHWRQREERPPNAGERLTGRGMPGWHWDPVQIMSHHHRPTERGRRLLGKLLAVAMLIALREMGEDEQSRPGLGRDAASLTGGQVPVLARQLGLGVGEG